MRRVLAVLLFASGIAQATSAFPADVAPCEPKRIPGVGLTCRRADGLLAVLGEHGGVLGLTHGPDAASVAQAGEAPAVPVACTAPGEGAYHVRVVYARAADDTDRFAGSVDAIRNIVAVANGMIDAASRSSGGSGAKLIVACAGGQVDVANAVLPTPRAAASFSTITEDLRTLGYSNPKLKYWVWYDDSAGCACAGVAHVLPDDRPTASNRNNGNADSPLFAVTLGTFSASVMLHELAHTLGAVQQSAPHTTKAWHCTDGLDVMCYRDGGSRSDSYTTSVCSQAVFDCGKNDYFNARPAGGSYLAGHWNLGSSVVRYIDRPAAPSISRAVCPSEAAVGVSLRCSFTVKDSSAGVSLVVDWGDGSTTRVPASGTVSPGTEMAATHTFGGAGSYTARITASDTGGLSSPTVTRAIAAAVDNTDPKVGLRDPDPGVLYIGCSTRSASAGARPTFARTGCVSLVPSDDLAGVGSVTVIFEGRRWTRGSAPFVFEFDVGGATRTTRLTIIVRDRAGNVVERRINVDVVG